MHGAQLLEVPAVEEYGWQDWDEQQYRKFPALNQSSLKLLLADSAMFFETFFGNLPPKKPSPSQQFGTECERFVFFDEQPANPLKHATLNPNGDCEPYQRIMANLVKHPLAHKYLFTGEAEYQKPALASDPFEGQFPVKALLDVWRPEGIIIDFKTAKDTTPSGFAKDAGNFGYYIQDVVYSEVVSQVVGRDPTFIFIVARNIPPYDVAVYQLGDRSYSLGMDKFQESIYLFRRHCELNDWRRIGSLEKQEIEVPGWIK